MSQRYSESGEVYPECVQKVGTPEFIMNCTMLLTCVRVFITEKQSCNSTPYAEVFALANQQRGREANGEASG